LLLYLVVFNYCCLCRDAVLEGNVEVEDTSASKSEVDKPPNTPDMSAHDAEAMVDSMLQDSPLPDPKRANEEIPEDDGSGKLPEEGDGKKLPEGGDNKQPEETPAGKLVVPCRKIQGIL
jgi:hypothetical protein